MKKTIKLPAMREIEISTAEFWLSTGAIWVTSVGEENTYYINEFDHVFYCKNRQGESTW